MVMGTTRMETDWKEAKENSLRLWNCSKNLFEEQLPGVHEYMFIKTYFVI